MSSRIESLRNYSSQLRDALRVHKDQLRDVKEDLNQERIKRKRLEDKLKEKPPVLEELKEELKGAKEELEDMKEALNKERVKRGKLEEQLEQLRRDGNPAIVDKSNNTKIKIRLSDHNPMDEDMKRKLLEDIKNNLRKLLITNCFILRVFVFLVVPDKRL